MNKIDSLFVFRLQHEEHAFKIKTTEIKDGKNKKIKYELICYCIGCGKEGTEQKSLLNIVIKGDTQKVQVCWSNIQLHIYNRDEKLWKRIWYVYEDISFL